MKLKKLLFLWLLLPVVPLPLNAENNRCLMVHFHDGSTVAFPLSTSPKVTFDGGVLQIATERYQVSNVKKYTFADAGSTGIENVNESDNVANFSNDGRAIVIKLKDGALPVKLYTLGGVEVPLHIVSKADKVLRIDLSRLSTGIHLLSIGQETIKIVRR